MSIFDWLQNRWKAKSAAYTYVHLETDHTDIDPQVAAALKPHKAGEHYFRLWLVGMSLANDREWFTAWQPAVYTLLRFRFGDQEETITHVAGPSQLGEKGFDNATRSVLLNYATTALVPFNGGAVELEAGLLAVPGKNDVQALLGTLTEFSKLLVVPELSSALNITTALANGFGNLVGATNETPTLRLHQTFAAGAGGGANTLRPGYFVVLDLPADSPDAKRLWVKQDRLCIGDSLAAAKALTGHHYMLFRIESAAERDDWESLSAIRDPFEEAIQLLGQSGYERDADKRAVLVDEADRRLGAAKLAAIRAKELTKLVGRNQVVQALQSGFDAAKKQLALGAVPRKADAPMASAFSRRISVAEAAALGVATEETVLGLPPLDRSVQREARQRGERARIGRVGQRFERGERLRGFRFAKLAA